MSTLWPVVALTLEVAGLATLMILGPGLAVAAYLAGRRRGILATVVETLAALPLVLPPTAVGLALLWLLGRGGPLGSTLAALGWQIPFTRWAAVLAAAVMAFPLLVRSARTALEEVDPRLLGVSRTLGRGPVATFLTVHLPLAWRGVLAGGVLAFTRALGEFGATVVVAGNIPGRTQTVALALFQNLQVGRTDAALQLAGIAAILALAALLVSEHLVGRRQRSLER